MTLKNFGIKYGPFIATGIGLGGMWTSLSAINEEKAVRNWNNLN